MTKQTPMMTYAESRRYAVVVPKYSHEGSAFTRDHSFHATEGAATVQADSLRASKLYRFVEVEDRAPLTAQCDGCDQSLPVERMPVCFEDGTLEVCDYCADCAAIVRSGNAFGIASLTAQQEGK
jgi:hypothetical protein